MLGLIGKKLGMTRIFDEDGRVVPVTVIEAGPCRVVQVKTEENDGYSSLQLGFGTRKEKNVTRPEKGHAAGAGEGYLPVMLREFRVDEVAGYELGQELGVGIFEPGEKVNVQGTTRGRGFQGVVKRHGFSGGDETHGNTAHRVPGSVGASADPSRVWKNKKLPGQMGNVRRKVRNLAVAKVDPERNYLYVKGAVPGPADGLVIVTKNVAKAAAGK